MVTIHECEGEESKGISDPVRGCLRFPLHSVRPVSVYVSTRLSAGLIQMGRNIM